jgi:hypothetical protein
MRLFIDTWSWLTLRDKRMEKNQSKGKLIRVEFTYDDGSRWYLEGEELEKWRKAVDGVSVLHWSHFGKTGFEEVNWKRVEE